MQRAVDAEIVRQWDAGASTAEIGRRMGLSRERVRQRLIRNGRRGRRKISAVSAAELLSAASTAHSQNEMASTLRMAKHRMRYAIRRAGLESEVRTQIARNRTAVRGRNLDEKRVAVTAAIRHLAQQLGHTPTVAQLRAAGVSLSRVQWLFGTATAAARAAGLTPNQASRTSTRGGQRLRQPPGSSPPPNAPARRLVLP